MIHPHASGMALPEDFDLHDPKWRFEERVQRLVNRGCTRHRAEQVVRYVIVTKELELPWDWEEKL